MPEELEPGLGVATAETLPESFADLVPLPLSKTALEPAHRPIEQLAGVGANVSVYQILERLLSFWFAGKLLDEVL